MPLQNTWQERTIGQSAVAIKNGLESKYGGSVEALVREAKAVTLLTMSGGEVNLLVKRELGDGSWEGEVLRSANVSDVPAVGSVVQFRLVHVMGGTL
jgi:hypothetical protein